MKIDADLDGGSITVVDAQRDDAVKLALRADTKADYRQWFHFRVRDAKGKACRFELDIREATYPDAYDGYRACASYDDEHWFRVPTESDGETLVITHQPEQDTVYYAYF